MFVAVARGGLEEDGEIGISSGSGWRPPCRHPSPHFPCVTVALPIQLLISQENIFLPSWKEHGWGQRKSSVCLGLVQASEFRLIDLQL